MTDVMYTNLFETNRGSTFIVVFEGYVRREIRHAKFTERGWEKVNWFKVFVRKTENGKSFTTDFMLPRSRFESREKLEKFIWRIVDGR